MSKIREFLAENPVVVGTGVAVALMGFMDFKGDFNADAPDAKSSQASKKSGKKYFDLVDGEDEFAPDDEAPSAKRKIASASGSGSSVVDSNPSDPNGGGYGNSFSNSALPGADSAPEYADYGSADDGPQVLSDEPNEPKPDENAPGIDCSLYPNDSLCVAASAGGGGSGAGDVVQAACDQNNPASECYVEPDVCTPGLMVNPRQGSYVKNPTVNVAPSHSCVTEIFYCVQKDGGCCDPVSSGSYTAPFLVSEEDLGVQDNGAYCLSVIAKGNTGELSPLYEYKYIVDDTTPDMVATFSPLLRIQSSEGADYVQIDSNNFGQNGFSAYVINSFEENPTALSKGCDEMVADYPPITNAIRSPAGDIVTPLEGLTAGIDNLNFYKFFENTMKFETNFLTAFVTFTDPIGDQLHSCQQAPTAIEVWDFTSFSTSGVVSDTSTLNTQSVSEFEGGFSAFGHFGGAGANVGIGRSNAGGSADCGSGAGECYLEAGYLNIVN